MRATAGSGASHLHQRLLSYRSSAFLAAIQTTRVSLREVSSPSIILAMADPLSIAASVIAVASLAYSSTQTLYQTISAIRDAPEVFAMRPKSSLT